MKKIIASLIVLTFTSISSYSYVGANLDDVYNSFSLTYGFSADDNVDNITGSVIGNITGNVLISGNITYAGSDGSAEHQLEFGLGYVIKIIDVHVVPRLGMVRAEEDDTQVYGSDLRWIQGN